MASTTSTIPEAAVPTTPASPATATTTTTKPETKRVSVPPPGYKFVKVYRGGKLITVRRKLSPDELAATEAAKNGPSNSAASAKAGEISESSPTLVKTPKSPTVSSPAQASTPNSSVIDPRPVVAPTASPTAKSVQSESTPKSPDNKQSQDVPQSPGSLKSPEIEAALDEQNRRYRESRVKKFRVSMVNGLANIIAHTMPTIEIGEFHHGDEIVHHVDDPSDDELEDDDDDGDDNDAGNLTEQHNEKNVEDHGKLMLILNWLPIFYWSSSANHFQL
jgi:hypothetical protein